MKSLSAMHPFKMLIICLLACLPSVCSAAEGDLIWEYPAEGSTIMTPALADGKLYTGVSIQFMCLNALTGSQLWAYDTQTFTWASAVVADDNVYFGSMNNATLYCLNAAAGGLAWKYTGGTQWESWSSPPAVAGSSIYSGAADERRLVSIDVRDGSLLWEFQTGMANEPIVSDGYVYTAGYNQDSNNVQYCLDAQTGSVVWESDPITTLGSPAALAGGYLYTRSYNIVCLDALTGAKVWQSEAAGLESSPAVLGGRVYACDSNTVYCISAKTGRTIWTYDYEGSIRSAQPAVTGDFVYIGARVPNRLLCLNAWSGILVFEYDAKDFVNAPVVDGGYAYFGIGNNATSEISGVYCVKAADGDTGSWPMLGHNPGRTGAAAPASPACTDSDGDGYAASGSTCGLLDCDDSDADASPGHDEVCGDAKDNNCDGQADEGCQGAGTTTSTSVAASTTTSTPGNSTTTTTTTSSSSTTTTVGGGTPCPAKKALGEDNPKLENLRTFRDNKLANSAIGRKVIHIYYNNAESINTALDRSPALRAMAHKFFEAAALLMGRSEE